MTQQGKNAIDMVLAESLIELSTKKPIEKITIKEITDKAGVIRPTFYNHFQDKYELIEWIINHELLEPIRQHADFLHHLFTREQHTAEEAFHFHFIAQIGRASCRERV